MPLSDPIPLRSTTLWPKFAQPEPLNLVYGRCTVPLTQADASRKFWHLSDGAIGGVDAIRRDGKPDKNYALHNTTDATSQPVAMVELAQPLAASARLTAEVRGRLHPITGVLLENPADVLFDLLRWAGQPVAATELADFRTACAGLTIGGMLTPGLTVRAQIAEIADAVGMLWSPALPGFAQRWPLAQRPEYAPIYARWSEVDTQEAQAEAQQASLATVLRVDYDWDWAQNRARRAVTLRADSADRYGERPATLTAKWLTSTAAAVARGTAWLEAYARPRWALSLSTDLDPRLPPGGWFTVSHPLLPVGGEFQAISAEQDWGNQRQRITTERAVGPLPKIRVINVGGLFAEPDSDLRITYANGVATLVVVDPNGAPIKDAVVTFDAQKGKTDRSGTVRFKAERGTHQVTIDAAGFAASTVEITL